MPQGLEFQRIKRASRLIPILGPPSRDSDPVHNDNEGEKRRKDGQGEGQISEVSLNEVFCIPESGYHPYSPYSANLCVHISTRI